MTILYLDADACPVKAEAYRVAGRYRVRVLVVARYALAVPNDPLIEMITRAGHEEVDDWIAEQANSGDVVVTADIPLAARCLVKGSRVLSPRGEPFTEDDIGAALAMRELMNTLRQDGTVSGGPAPMTQKDRSRFLSKLDELINAALRGK